MPKCCIFSSNFNVKMAAQKSTDFDVSYMHADMTAVTVQSNNIVSSEAKDS